MLLDLKIKETVQKHFPEVYIFLRKICTPNQSVYIKRNTKLIIEGYGGSGNSFAFRAFLLSQPRAVQLAHHLHLVPHVLVGVKRKIPTMVLIRHPKDAILSLQARFSTKTIELKLKRYIFFYQTLLPYRQQFVVAKFEEVVNDFGKCIQKLNDKYRTTFVPFNHTKENVQKCFEQIEQNHLAKQKIRKNSKFPAKPDVGKDIIKKRVSTEFEKDSNKKLLKKAEELYNQFTKNKE